MTNTSEIDIRAARRAVGVAETGRRFGGLDVRATLVGMLTALALLVLLGGSIGAAIGPIGYQTGLENTAVVSGLVAIAVMLLAGLLGGIWGERYHRRADATLVATRPGAIARERPGARAR